MKPQLECVEFGRRLIETNDLDPVYVVLHQANLDQDTLRRWLLAYWCFYHLGTASYIAQTPGGEEDYWDRMNDCASTKDYPRSAERRHFRGDNALKSVAFLRGQGLKVLFWGLDNGEETNADRVIEYVQKWTGFGPWIAFKVADMVERLGLRKLVFNYTTAMYDSPRQAAHVLWSRYWKALVPRPEGILEHQVPMWATRYLLERLELGGEPYLAPPRYERTVGFQEVETILCKWKSYLNGHYHLGEDISAVRSGLAQFGRCNIAQKLLAGGRKGRLW